MVTLRSAACGVMLVLLTAACAEWSTGPDIVGATPTTVSIRYDATKVTTTEADEAARVYCDHYNRQPRLRSRFASKPEMSYADYSCVTSSQ
jgi:hypothetical protein